MIRRPGLPSLVAVIQGGEGRRYLQGTAKFFQMPGGILVEVEISGLPTNGFFGLHIHEGGSCTGQLFADTGMHYDPTNKPHPMHVGDLPPLLSAGGKAYMAVLTDRFSMHEIVGRTVMIHSKRDDFRTQPAGDSGEKIACGVIQAVKRT